jgi:hypothetical protein
MVFTIEPAFQVKEEQINIRCEVLIVVTGSGAEMFSDVVPLNIDQIEKQMRGHEISQDYLTLRGLGN